LTVIQAILQGIIQGATEFLPVSSSGHLSLAQHFMGVQVTSLLFDVMLHIGTLIAVLVVYYKLVWRLLKELVFTVGDVFTGKFKWSQMNADRRLLMMLIIGLIPLFLLFITVPGTGMKIKDYADLWATDHDILIEGFSLIGTSILLTLGIFATKRTKANSGAHSKNMQTVGGRKQFNVIDAVTVGLIQCVAAVFPGLSRSGSTLSGGLMRGVNRQTALDYSFVIGIPSIMAAAALTLKDAAKAHEAISAAPMVAGVITAAIVGFFAIKLLRWMVASNKLGIFAVYTFLLGITVVVMGFIEHTTGTGITIAIHF